MKTRLLRKLRKDFLIRCIKPYPYHYIWVAVKLDYSTSFEVTETKDMVDRLLDFYGYKELRAANTAKRTKRRLRNIHQLRMMKIVNSYGL